ncbi:MAG TPA: hypothetical protein VF605_10140 [Allosphingosinicella sp.]|jgi:hypothetical protein
MAGAARAALERAVAFLESVQLPSGELPVHASNDPTLAEGGTLDPSVFPTALAAYCLSFWPGAGAIRQRALGFLAAEMDRNGLWRHWTREHPHCAQLPPDLDDTSCASAAIADPARLAGNRQIMLCNRRRDGLFLTWILPRLRLGCAPHRRATWPQLRHAATLFLFFRRTSARPGDVDAVVNANALLHLGEFDGREKVVAFLLDLLRRGAEAECDKWYENPFAVRYFLSRALAGEPEAAALIARRAAAAAPADAFERALALCASLNGGIRPAEAEVEALLALQSPDGSWPRAALYHGGRLRRAGGGFAPRHPDTPHWGSEALTTAFCVEALSRWGCEAPPSQ